MNTKTGFAIIVAAIALLFITFTPLAADVISAEEQNYEDGFSVLNLIIVLGACALASLLATFLTGLFRIKLRRRFLILHKTLAWLTVILALTHAITVILVF
jgi:hypothetical protein